MSTTELLALFFLFGQVDTSPSVDEVRTRTRALLETLCRDRCDVVGVEIRKKREAPPRGSAPGFDDAAAARVVPSEISIALLFDRKLSKELQSFVSDRVRQRIGELGLPVLITESSRSFPSLPEEPDPAPTLAPPAPAPPAPPMMADPPPLPPAPVERPDARERILERLIEALPLFLLFGLLAWLVLRVLSRMERLAQLGSARDTDPAITLTPELVDDAPSSAILPPPGAEELRADLARYRGSTRRIFRRLLLREEHDKAARAVALLGDFVVRDLSHDPTVRRTLAALGRRTAETLRAPLTDEDKEEVLRMVHAELVADRVANRGDDVREEFEVLLGWSPESFAAMVSRVDERLRVVLLRHAPAYLTESYLRGLTADVRAEHLRTIIEAPPADPEEIAALADRIAREAQAALVGGYESDHIADLLDSLDAGEQDELVSSLESTRPDFVRRNIGQLPVESSLLRVPDEALGAAWARVPFEDWLAYLRSAPESIRARSLASCPQRLRVSVEEELSLRVAPDPERAAQARRRIIRAVLAAAPLGAGNLV